jgi:hypothetical protein
LPAAVLGNSDTSAKRTKFLLSKLMVRGVKRVKNELKRKKMMSATLGNVIRKTFIGIPHHVRDLVKGISEGRVRESGNSKIPRLEHA